MTTIHGFCNRLARRAPGRRRDRPALPRARRAGGRPRRRARPSTRRSSGSSPSGEARAREELVAAFDIDAAPRADRRGAHAELRSRGDAEPVLPEPPRPEPAQRSAAAAAADRGAGGAEAEADAKRELLERGRRAARERRKARRGSKSCARCGPASQAKPLAAYREAIEAAIARCAEAGEGGARLPRTSALLLRALLARFDAAKDRARRARLRGPPARSRVRLLSERDDRRAAYRERFEPPDGRRVPGHQPRSSCG